MPEKTHTLLAPNPSFHLTKTDSRSPPTIFIFEPKFLQINSRYATNLDFFRPENQDCKLRLKLTKALGRNKYHARGRTSSRCLRHSFQYSQFPLQPSAARDQLTDSLVHALATHQKRRIIDRDGQLKRCVIVLP